MVTTAQAKKIIKGKLAEMGKDFKLTARTVGFSDLARGSCIFVKVHGWQPDPSWDDLNKLARDNGFRVETSGDVF